MADDSGVKTGPAYVPYKSFRNFINNLADIGIPARIDRSVVSNLSGSTQAMLLSALRFLKLTDDEGKPTKKLHELVEAGDKYGEVLAGVLTGAYPFLAEKGLDITKATLHQLEEQFKDYGLGGSTVDKAVAFFLTAAKDAGLSLSQHLKPKRFRSGDAHKAKARAGAKKRTRGHTNDADEEDDGVSYAAPEGTEKFEIPIPGKPAAVVMLPKNLSQEDWEMLQGILGLYAKRLLAAD